MNMKLLFAPVLAVCVAGLSFTAVAQSESSSGKKRSGLISTDLGWSDIEFLRSSTAAALGQLEIARVVAKQSTTESVVQFAGSVEKHLTEELARLKELAFAHGVTVPGAPDAEALQKAIEMKSLEPSKLDSRFMSELIKARGAQIAGFQKAAASQAADIRNVALETIKVITDELLFIQSFSKQEQAAPTAAGATPAPTPAAPKTESPKTE